jgi:DNA processing protein
LTIVSGLAIGIDTLAHNAALTAKGRTIAILGSGLDKANIYPAQNRHLAEKIIAEGGALVSEFNPGTPALKHHFPQRNRIVSGLSLGTLVIEADQKSGSLITAKFALEQNREVFAVPGSIYSQFSLGTNSLIREGAKAVLCSEDIAEGLNLEKVKMFVEAKKIIPESQEEKIILECLGKDSKHINEIVRELKLDMSKINSTLTIMEMKGMIKNLGNMTYVIVNS